MKALHTITCLLMLLPHFASGQRAFKHARTYSRNDVVFKYHLVLYPDFTFAYKQSATPFDKTSRAIEVHTKSRGEWYIMNDTVKLLNYEMPWAISNVTAEQRNDLPTGRIVVRVVAGAEATKSVAGLRVWVNDDCTTENTTDSGGRVEFKLSTLRKISLPYNEYHVENPAANYYVLTLSECPVFSSLPVLKWTKWIVTNKRAIPMECGSPLDHIALRRRRIF